MIEMYKLNSPVGGLDMVNYYSKTDIINAMKSFHRISGSYCHHKFRHLVLDKKIVPIGYVMLETGEFIKYE